MKQIVIIVRNGLVSISRQDRDTTLIVKDYDVQEETEHKDGDGRFYERIVYTRAEEPGTTQYPLGGDGED